MQATMTVDGGGVLPDELMQRIESDRGYRFAFDSIDAARTVLLGMEARPS